MSSKPCKWPFGMIHGRHERNQREFSVAGFIYVSIYFIFYVQKYFSGPLTGATVDPPMGSAVMVSSLWRNVSALPSVIRTLRSNL